MRPFLAEIRALSEPEFCAHLEMVVMSHPATDEVMRLRLAASRPTGIWRTSNARAKRVAIT